MGDCKGWSSSRLRFAGRGGVGRYTRRGLADEIGEQRLVDIALLLPARGSRACFATTRTGRARSFCPRQAHSDLRAAKGSRLLRREARRRADIAPVLLATECRLSSPVSQQVRHRTECGSGLTEAATIKHDQIVVDAERLQSALCWGVFQKVISSIPRAPVRTKAARTNRLAPAPAAPHGSLADRVRWRRGKP
jgi:hypothetical protein